MSNWLVTIPDEADGRLANAVLEAVEKGASTHTLMIRWTDEDKEIGHARLGVNVKRLGL